MKNLTLAMNLAAWSMVIAALPFITHAGEAKATPESVLERYKNAAAVQLAETNHWVINSTVTPHWIRDKDQFWYQRETPDGHRFTVFDAATRAKSDAFDHARLAQELTKSLGMSIESNDLPLSGLNLSADGTWHFAVGPKSFRYDSVKGLADEAEPPANYAISPDGQLGVFFKAQDLWVKNFKSGAETQLTTDGEPDYVYGGKVSADIKPQRTPNVVWSPDSKRIFTAQTDDRKVLDAPVVEFAPVGSVPTDKPSKEPSTENPFRAKLVHYKVAFPGDLNIPTFRLAIIDVKDGHQLGVRYQALPATRMNDTPMDGNRMWWSADSKTAYFVDIERGEKAVHVMAVDTSNGATRELFSETSDSYVELGLNVYTPATIWPLPKTNQLIWYSERSGWAHLYLYDLSTGKLIRALTSGNWAVNDVLAVDEEHREVLVSIEGRSKDRSPYYREVARVDLRTGALKILSSSDDDHETLSPSSMAWVVAKFTSGDAQGLQAASPSGRYFVETVATASKPSKTLLRDSEGRLVATIEEADASRLPPSWKWPALTRLTGADGKTEIDALVFRPWGFDPKKKYALIDCIYGGPQTVHIPRGVGQMDYTLGETYAALGFVAVIIDGRGTTERGRDFHTQSYGKAEAASNLEDHIAAIRQLAASDSSIDLNRVGITGFSGGGYMTASALLRYPDFFKVGVAGSGNHDQRIFWNTWGERYEGYPDGEYYKAQANLSYVGNLKGKLLLVHGLLDTGVHPSNVFQLEQALIDANKDYDTLLWPRARHELPSYGLRRTWDYFVQNLAGDTPPVEFKVKTDIDVQREKAEALAEGIKDKKPVQAADATKGGS
jgi:dipeptidyl-peptidase 4